MNKKRLYRFLSVMAAGIIAASSLMMAGDTASAAKKKKAAEVDLNGTYHAALGIQTATEIWIQRMAYYEGTQNKYYGTEDADKMLFKSKETGKDEAATGTFQDVEIKGNGTYTVSLDGAEFQNETTISQLHVATDIPVNDTIKFSNVSVKIDDKTIVEFEEAVMEDEENYMQGGMVVLAFNHWREGLKSTLEEKGLPENADNGYDLLMGSGSESVSITFTVSGFAYDNEEAQGDDASAETTENDAATADEGASSEVSAGTEANTTSSSTTTVIIVIACVVVVVVIAGVVVTKKKKS